MKTCPWRAFLGTLTLLTRCPVPQRWCRGITASDLVLGSIFFAPIGAILGVGLWALAEFGTRVGMDTRLLALVLVAWPLIATRFLHLDGLGDCFDGFLADKSPERRLEIMKDSRVGSFGVVGIVLFLLLDWILFQKVLELKDHRLWIWLIAVPALARWGAVLLAWMGRYPRAAGTGAFLVGQVPTWVLFLSLFFAQAVLFTLAMISGLFPQTSVMALTMFLAPLIWYVWSRRAIGGVTGDVLGAAILTGEVLLLGVLVW